MNQWAFTNSLVPPKIAEARFEKPGTRVFNVFESTFWPYP